MLDKSGCVKGFTHIAIELTGFGSTDFVLADMAGSDRKDSYKGWV